MSSPLAASNIAVDRRRSFGVRRILPELPGKDLGAGQLRPSRRTPLLADQPRRFKENIY